MAQSRKTRRYKMFIAGAAAAVAVSLPALASANTLVECTVINEGGHKYCYYIPTSATNNWQIKAAGTGVTYNAAATPYSWVQAEGGASGLKGASDYSWTAPTAVVPGAWVLTDPRWCSCGVSATYQINYS